VPGGRAPNTRHGDPASFFVVFAYESWAKYFSKPLSDLEPGTFKLCPKSFLEIVVMGLIVVPKGVDKKGLKHLAGAS
jgi:hypothetical protein